MKEITSETLKIDIDHLIKFVSGYISWIDEKQHILFMRYETDKECLGEILLRLNEIYTEVDKEIGYFEKIRHHVRKINAYYKRYIRTDELTFDRFFKDAHKLFIDLQEHFCYPSDFC